MLRHNKGSQVRIPDPAHSWRSPLGDVPDQALYCGRSDVEWHVALLQTKAVGLVPSSDKPLGSLRGGKIDEGVPLASTTIETARYVTEVKETSKTSVVQLFQQRFLRETARSVWLPSP